MIARRIWFLLALVLSTAATANAQSKTGTQNTLLGTWKLRVNESKADPGPLPRSEVRTYSVAGPDGVKLTVEGIDAGGNRFAYSYTARFDGKDYPLTGTGTRNGGDMLALTRIDPYTVESVVKKAGVVVNKTRLVVSRDRKSTISEAGTNQSGQSTSGVRVYSNE
jgi:hypothetical protein